MEDLGIGVTFWRLQVAGWMALYVLVLVLAAPHFAGGDVFPYNSWACALLFIASFALRPLCRAACDRWRSSWFRLEAYAVLLSAAGGYLVTFVTQILVYGLPHLDLTVWALRGVQCSLVLFLWCNLYFGAKWRVRMEQARLTAVKAEAQARDARLDALRLQLSPHFLFNALNAVSTLVQENRAAEADEVIGRISDLLRGTLAADGAARSRLSEEVSLISDYLAIEQTRLGPRLRVDLELEEGAADALVPGLILQPLVENAVKHGIAAQPGPGTVQVRAKRLDRVLQIVVSNSGPRFGSGPCVDGLGVGLENVRRRLRTIYGDAASLSLRWPTEGGCEAELLLPFQPKCREYVTCER